MGNWLLYHVEETERGRNKISGIEAEKVEVVKNRLMTSYARHVTQNEFFLSHYFLLANIFPTIYGLLGLFPTVRRETNILLFCFWGKLFQRFRKTIKIRYARHVTQNEFFYRIISASRISFQRYMVCLGYFQRFVGKQIFYCFDSVQSYFTIYNEN